MAHIWMSRGTHMNESWHTYKWVTAHTWICKIFIMLCFRSWVMAHTWMSHGTTHMNGSWHAYEWVLAHVYISHGTHIDVSCQTDGWVMWHAHAHLNDVIFQVCVCVMSHGTHMNESWHNAHEWVLAHIWMSHTYEWVMAQRIWMSHGTHMNESHIWIRHTYEWATHMNESRTLEWCHISSALHIYIYIYIYICHIPSSLSYLYMWHVSVMCVSACKCKYVCVCVCY